MQKLWGIPEPMTSYKPKQVDALVLIRDGLTMVIDGIDELLEDREQNDQPKYTLEQIAWANEKGPKGDYEKATEQNSEDFRALINDLEAHDGKLQRDGFFIWKFNNFDNTIGRKKVKA